jgi:hypothetical protein
MLTKCRFETNYRDVEGVEVVLRKAEKLDAARGAKQGA